MNSRYLQRLNRALRGRLVHAKRARTLRQRGEVVTWAGSTKTGKKQYRWIPLISLIQLEARDAIFQSEIAHRMEARSRQRWSHTSF